MPADLRHFSISTDDVQRAKRFYEAVFGWDFQPWGPPGFYLIGGLGVGGALGQGRREIVPGARMLGVEATMAVEDVEATGSAIERAGGKVASGPFHIETVGTGIWFQDSEGNVAGAMRYDPREPTPRPGPDATGVLRHFAINADEVQRAKGFYEQVFGWTFEPWGPPDFYIVRNAGATFNGALQGRRELKPGARMIGYEISIGVADIQALVRAVEAAGGQMVMRPVVLPTVGTLGYFEDTEGNLIGVCQYEPGARFD